MSATAHNSRFFAGHNESHDCGGRNGDDNSCIADSHECVVNKKVEATNQFVNDEVVLVGDDTEKEKNDDKDMIELIQRKNRLQEEQEFEVIGDRAGDQVSTDLPLQRSLDEATKENIVRRTTSYMTNNDQEFIVIDEDGEDDVNEDNDRSYHAAGQLGVYDEGLREGESVEGRDKENLDAGENARTNPFAQFAFAAMSGSVGMQTRGPNWIASKIQEPIRKKAKIEKVNGRPMSDLSIDEQESVRRKWYGLVVTPCTISLEDARFQIMVASRLHARCQEAVVRKCMISLHGAGVLTCPALAECDADVLANLLTSLQYYNTKSRHLIKAAKELLEKFDGMVPESKDALLTITGIGPVMADLLYTINRRAVHQEHAPWSSNSG